MFPQQKTNQSALKAPGAGKASGMSSVSSSGQAVNKGSLLSGLKHESKVKPNTGTADGDRAVQDFAKAGFFQQASDVGRQADRTNAEEQQRQESLKLQAYEQNRQVQQQAFRNRMARSNNQSQLSQTLKSHNQDMYWNHRNFLVGLLEP